MTQFEDQIQAIVEGLDPVVINTNLTRQAKFYWGTSEDLPAFLKKYKEESFPVIWSVSRPDQKLIHGYQRDSEICFCTRETREILNTERMEAAFKLVLIPLWEAFEKELKRSTMIIEKATESFEKFPNYSVNNAKKENAVSDVWDVLKVGCRIKYYEDFNC